MYTCGSQRKAIIFNVSRVNTDIYTLNVLLWKFCINYMNNACNIAIDCWEEVGLWYIICRGYCNLSCIAVAWMIYHIIMFYVGLGWFCQVWLSPSFTHVMSDVRAFRIKEAILQFSDGEIYSGVELTSWTFQWDLTL